MIAKPLSVKQKQIKEKFALNSLLINRYDKSLSIKIYAFASKWKIKIVYFGSLDINYSIQMNTFYNNNDLLLNK